MTGAAAVPAVRHAPATRRPGRPPRVTTVSRPAVFQAYRPPVNPTGTSAPPRDVVRAAVAEQTLALAAEAARLSAADLAAPSALPGWTRGHLLAHVRLNAEAFVGVLAAAAGGAPGLMYPSREQRDADIEAAAGDSPGHQVEALLVSADAFARAWAAVPPDRYTVEFTSPAGWSRPVGVVDFFRWREVVLHHCDLHPAGAGGRTAVDVLAAADPALVARMLAETCEGFAARDDVPPLVVTVAGTDRSWRLHDGDAAAVSGSAAALAAWLTGRSAGAGLSSTGPLPALPPFA